MIELLQLARPAGRERLQQAVETALATGCTDAAAVQHLFHAQDLNHVASRRSTSARWRVTSVRCR